jgi:hypothetical protein
LFLCLFSFFPRVCLYSCRLNSSIIVTAQFNFHVQYFHTSSFLYVHFNSDFYSLVFSFLFTFYLSLHRREL